MERATISRQQQTQRAFLGAALMDPARAREYIIKRKLMLHVHGIRVIEV